MSLARDQLGRIWAGTEDKGVWCFDPQAPDDKAWTQFTTKDGLGDDNAYAVVADVQNRIWIGHLNHGVSVFNGRSWKNYGASEGVVGERVFSLALDPSTGNVWIATNAGLTCYFARTDTWRHFSAKDGLPTGQINAVACDAVGYVYAGTQTNGLAWSSAASDYQQWQTIKGPPQDALPLLPHGEGIPTNQITDMLVSRFGDVLYVATPTGLARSADLGESWSFVRGEDWLDKAKGLAKTPNEEQMQPGMQARTTGAPLLREDYVTCLTEDDAGRLWIGYRTHGWEIRRPRLDRQTRQLERVLFRSEDASAQGGNFLPYVSAILPLESAAPTIAQYGDGVLKVGVKLQNADSDAPNDARQLARWDAATIAANNAAPLPAPLAAPKLEELQALLKQVRAVPKLQDNGPLVVAMADDWRTQGDWRGRYGRYYARLHAMNSPHDLVWGAGAQGVPYAARIGEHTRPGDNLRYWVQWNYSDNPRVLEMPTVYFHSRLKKGLTAWEAQDPARQKYRRQAEIDDHGEEYPLSHDGPHLYATLTVPRGDFILSLYDFNKDGHDGSNRLRDYRFSLRPHPANLPLNAIDGFDNWPELASGRIRDFWGGVYKRFLVRGPQTLTVQVNRNYSFNTILAGVFLDAVDETPEPYFPAPKITLAQSRAAKTAAPALPTADNEAATVEQLWRELERVQSENPTWWATEARAVYARLLPWFAAARPETDAQNTPQVLARLGSCYYQLCLFEPWEALQKQRGLTTAREIEKSLTWDGKSDSSGYGRVAVLKSRIERAKAAKVAAVTAAKQPESKTTVVKTGT